MKRAALSPSMNVLVLSSGQDTGGQGYRIKRAFDKCTDWRVRAVHVTDTFIKYPADIKFDIATAQALYNDADVVHHKNGLALYERLDGLQRKPAIIHHQGTRLRDHPREVNREAVSVGAVQLVSTVDLLADVTDGTWLPSPYDLGAIRERYTQRRAGGKRLRIGHAPTNRRAKGTQEILSALDRISLRHDIEVDLIEGVEYRVCLSRKSRCDIYIDQVTHGYGNNTIECWAMGVPVITGWSDPADRARFVEQTGFEPPFAEATVETLDDQILRLIDTPALRAEYAEKGRAFAEQFHSEQAVVDRLIPIYESASKTKGVRALRRYDSGREARVA